MCLGLLTQTCSRGSTFPQSPNGQRPDVQTSRRPDYTSHDHHGNRNGREGIPCGLTCFLTKRNIQHMHDMQLPWHSVLSAHSSALMVVTRFRDSSQQPGHSWTAAHDPRQPWPPLHIIRSKRWSKGQAVYSAEPDGPAQCRVMVCVVLQADPGSLHAQSTLTSQESHCLSLR